MHILLWAQRKTEDNIFCWEYTRIVQNDGTIRFEKRYYQLQNSVGLSVRPKRAILVRKHLDGSVSLWSTRGKISYSIVDQPVPAENIKLGQDMLRTSKDARLNKFTSPWSKFNPGWLKQTQGCTQVVAWLTDRSYRIREEEVLRVSLGWCVSCGQPLVTYMELPTSLHTSPDLEAHISIKQ